ncbi:MAG: MFS transporter [Spirochaetales bacterium]|nr:MFS transporter [Spirochaetales bacterium]
MAVSTVILAFIAFISLGMPDGLLGVAWPFMRQDFAQPLDALGGLLISSVVGYTLSSFFSGEAVRRLGLGNLLALSVVLTSGALIGYTVVPLWYLVFPFGFLGGLGAGAIDAGLNSYFEKHHGEGLMQWLHAFFGIGITTGPLVMTWAVTGPGQWRIGYWIVAVFQATVGMLFFLRRRSWDRPDDEVTEEQHSSGVPLAKTLGYAPSWLSGLLFFVYVGMEVTLGHWGYTYLTEGKGADLGVAGLITGSYWGFFTIGRIIAGLVAFRIRSIVLIYGAITLALVGTGFLLLGNSQTLVVTGIGLYGFSLAPIFPAMVSTTSHRVGREHATNTVGMQMAFAGIGVGILPTLVGFLAARVGLFVIPYTLLGMVLALFTLLTLSNLLGRSHSPGIPERDLINRSN